MIKAGTTEGRFRMAMPDILAGMKDVCPDEDVRASMADAVTLKNQVIDGKIDFAFSGLTEDVPEALEYSLLLPGHVSSECAETECRVAKQAACIEDQKSERDQSGVHPAEKGSRSEFRRASDGKADPGLVRTAG